MAPTRKYKARKCLCPGCLVETIFEVAVLVSLVYVKEWPFGRKRLVKVPLCGHENQNFLKGGLVYFRRMWLTRVIVATETSSLPGVPFNSRCSPTPVKIRFDNIRPLTISDYRGYGGYNHHAHRVDCIEFLHRMRVHYN